MHKALRSTTLYYKGCTKQLPVLLCTTKLAQTTSQYYFVPQSLHKALRSNTLYCNACTKNFPVQLCTTKLAQTTSQYYFVLQRLHKTTPSITLYYKACTTTSKYYFVLQSLHKALRSTTLYYKSCTKHSAVLLCTTKLALQVAHATRNAKATHSARHSKWHTPLEVAYTTRSGIHHSKYFPVLLCITKLAQSTPQYYFVLQKLHKTLPSTTLYYKACTNHSAVLLCTTRLAQNTS